MADSSNKKKLKIRLKESTSTQAQLAPELEESKMPLLLEAVGCIYSSQPVRTSLEELYRAVEVWCFLSLVVTFFS